MAPRPRRQGCGLSNMKLIEQRGGVRRVAACSCNCRNGPPHRLYLWLPRIHKCPRRLHVLPLAHGRRAADGNGCDSCGLHCLNDCCLLGGDGDTTAVHEGRQRCAAAETQSAAPSVATVADAAVYRGVARTRAVGAP